MLGPGVAFTGRVVVRLQTGLGLAVRNTIQTSPTLAPQGLGSVLSATPQTPVLPDINSLLAHLSLFNALQASSPVPVTLVPQVALWEDAMASSPFPRLHSLFSYWIADMRGRSTTSFPATVAAIGNNPGIDLAYAERNLREPAGAWAVTPDALTTKQDYVYGLGYLSPSNLFGVNANNEAVWQSFSGAGVGFVDIERGWRLTHDDIPPAANVKNPDPGGDGTLIGRNLARDVGLGGTTGFLSAGARRHGTESVSVAVGRDHVLPDLGVVGLAPGATLLGVASRVSDDGTNEWMLTEAIVAACAVMKQGDVMLIEVETAGGIEGGFPVEVDWLHFDAIRLACANGFVVIEPAGNGWTEPGSPPVDKAHDLDQPIPPRPLNATTPTPNLNRHHPDFTDSGAIMVASCAEGTQPAGGHERQVKSSYGSRIDCYAWGAQVTAADGDADDDYTSLFGGTSSASAIIAGAALLVQEMAMKSPSYGSALTPADLRYFLQRDYLGTPIYEIGASALSTPIGVMPDLFKLAASLVGVPDVFVRDAIGDDGSVPSLNLAQSPDIIVRSAWGGGDPDAAFGEASGFAEQELPNDDIVLNQTSYLFVRMRNRGLAQATGTVARIYWAETAPYIPPSDWHQIGTTAPVDVAPAGTIIGMPYGALKVAGPITWSPTAATLPVPHACFVALLDHVLDPAPPITAASSNTWADFFAFIQSQNNAAWRNFNVLPLASASAGAMMAKAAFNINGPPDEAAIFDIEVERRGPREHNWRIVVPKVLVSRLTPEFARRLERYDDGSRDERYLVPIEGSGVRLTSLRLLPGEHHRCLIEVAVPRTPARTADQLSITQLYRGRVVGRVSFVLTEQSWRREKSS